jgi:hypothetical protein
MRRSSLRRLGIISESDAQELLETRHDALFRTVAQAFRRMQAEGGPVSLTKLPHVGHLTNAMHALTQEEARDRFSESAGAEVVEGRTFFLEFDKRALVRFKKVNAELRTSNYPTARAKALDGQMLFEDGPDLPIITVGYEPDAVWSKLVSVTVFFAIDKDPRWNYELTGKTDNDNSNVHAFSPLADEVIVKPKRQASIEEYLNRKKPS